MTDPQTQRIHCQTSANSYSAVGSHSPSPKQQVLSEGIQLHQALSASNQKYNLTLKNKKEIRYFLSYFRKECPTFSKKRCQIWLQILGLLLNGKSKQNNYKCHSNSLQEIKQISSQQFKPLCILQKPFKSALLHLIVIAYHIPLQCQTILYDVEVVNLLGSIVYKKVNVCTFTALSRQVFRLQAELRYSLTAVRNQTQLLELKIIKQQFQTFIRSFWDLKQIIDQSRQNIDQRINTHMNCKLKKKHISEEQVAQIQFVINKYLLVKDQFQTRITQTQTTIITLDQIRIMTIAYNLIIADIKSLSDPFQNQIQPNKDIILTQFQQAINFKARKTKKKTTIKGNQQHCPFPLQNAHMCYNCNSKRIYFYCPTCTQTHNQIIALCWDCYSPYHQSIMTSQEKILQPIIEEDIIGKWETLNNSTANIVGEWQLELAEDSCLGQ